MKWFHQHRLGGLGNFIMATPALRLLYEKDGQKINTFFDAPYIADLYRRCPFIKILGRNPGGKPFATSVRPKRINKRESDSEALCRILLGNNHPKMPNTYVDNYISKQLTREDGKKYVAVFHGCLGGFKPKKDIGKVMRQYILDRIKKAGHVPVLLGDKKDVQNFWNVNNLKGSINYLGKLGIQESVSILSQCDYFISIMSPEPSRRRGWFCGRIRTHLKIVPYLTVFDIALVQNVISKCIKKK
jgi:ADP-heptose:LPS heptosyltransferase